MANMMKSLVLERPNKLVLIERPIPEPRPGEVLIRVKSAGICHTDFIALRGDFPGCKYPTVLGHEFSGIVEKCGQGVLKLRPNDRVVCMGFGFCRTCKYCRRGLENACKNISVIPFHMDGAYQQMVCLPAAMVFCFDESLSFNKAALTEPASNGYAAVDRANLYPGEHVVIIGPGPIGLLAVAAADLKSPASLILLGTRAERLQMGTRLGATHTVNVLETDPYEVVMDISDGHGADVVILCAGTETAWEFSGRVLAKYGRVIVESLPDRADSKWPVAVFDFTAKHISYLGVSAYTACQFRATLDLMQAKKIDVMSLITHTFSLDDYADAFETCAERTGGAVKVVIEIAKE
ncbi:MAG: alcohol dehydrogenase catalytic domain-containing protein [Planctomycetota bacterium]